MAKQQMSFNAILVKIPKSELATFIENTYVKWLKSNHRKYYEPITNIIKEYANKVDIAKKFRQQWNSSHPPWDRYAEKTEDASSTSNFANHVKYEINGANHRFYNDAKPKDAPFTYTNYKGEVHTWGSYSPTAEDDLSNWIEGDLKTGDSYIHPIPPYTIVGKYGRAGLLIWRGWIDNSEWKNTWYEGDPYMHKALEDPRVKKIFGQMTIDFYKYLKTQIIKKYGDKKSR